MKNPVDTGFFTPEVCVEALQTSSGSHHRNRLRDFASGVSAPKRFDMFGRVKNIVDTIFFTPDICARAQSSTDVNEKSSSRISR